MAHLGPYGRVQNAGTCGLVLLGSTLLGASHAVFPSEGHWPPNLSLASSFKLPSSLSRPTGIDFLEHMSSCSWSLPAALFILRLLFPRTGDASLAWTCPSKFPPNVSSPTGAYQGLGYDPATISFFPQEHILDEYGVYLAMTAADLKVNCSYFTGLSIVVLYCRWVSMPNTTFKNLVNF